MTRIRGTVHDNVCTFTIISPRIILRMTNVSEISCKEDHKSHPHPHAPENGAVY